jgi:hypothetical protein
MGTDDNIRSTNSVIAESTAALLDDAVIDIRSNEKFDICGFWQVI